MAPATKAAPLPPWGSAIAGATGAVLANAMVYPLDMFVALPLQHTPNCNLLINCMQSQDSVASADQTQVNGPEAPNSRP